MRTRWLPLVIAAGLIVVTVGWQGTRTHAQVPPLPLPTSTTTSPDQGPPETAPPDTSPPETSPPTTAPPDTAPAEDVPTETVPDVPAPPPAFEVGPSPEPSVPAQVPVPPPSTTTPTSARRPVVSAGVAAAISGSFALAVGAVLLVALLLIGLSSRVHPGGIRMNDPRRRWRLLAGLACLALAAIIGIVGWLKLSLEPQVNRQIPYLASAGMTLVLLAALGGSLLVAEQLRADDERIDELEDAVRQLATTLAPLIEAPARLGPDAGAVSREVASDQQRPARRQKLEPRDRSG